MDIYSETKRKRESMIDHKRLSVCEKPRGSLLQSKSMYSMHMTARSKSDRPDSTAEQPLIEINKKFKFAKNKLIYYQTLKQSLRPVFYNGSLSSVEFFEGNPNDLGDVSKQIAMLLPTFMRVIKEAEININHNSLFNILKLAPELSREDKKILELVRKPLTELDSQSSDFIQGRRP